MPANLIVLFITMVIFFITVPAHGKDANIDRIEPPSWWVGFENRNLQLMVYGTDIKQWDVSIPNRRITLKKVTRVENENYLFIDLEISRRAKPGRFDIHFKHSDGATRTVPYTLHERDDGSAQRAGFNSSDVIYLITPDRFANGDPSNDTVEGYTDTLNRSDDYGRHGGDLQGLIDNLDYIAEMGFTSIWLNPVLENAMAEQSYHGYATTDYYKIDPRFGTNEQYRLLAEEARKRGIGLIKDHIANHSGSNHWFVLDPPTADWVNMEGQYTMTTHMRTTVQDPYASQADLKAFEDGWFVESMPDLNQRNPLMATYLIQNSIWWIEYAGLHGIRQDTYPYPDSAFMAEWTRAIMAEYPNFNIVGEEWSLNPLVIAYWLRGRENPDGYVSHLPSAMDFPLQHLITAAFKEPEAWNTGLIKLYEALVNDVLYPDPLSMVTITDNHDMDRIHKQMDGDAALTKMAVAYLLTMRGTPQLYYGTEILMANEKPHDHGQIRTEFPGGWPGHDQNAFTGEGLSAEQRDMQEFVKTLLNWRKDAEVIHTGKLMHFSPREGTYAYFRYNDDGLVMVAFNKNPEPVTLDMSRFKEVMGTRSRARNILTGNDIDAASGVSLPARSPLILEFHGGS